MNVTGNAVQTAQYAQPNTRTSFSQLAQCIPRMATRPEAANSGYVTGTHALRSLPDDVVPAYYSTVPLLTALNSMALFVYVVFARVELLVLQLHYDTKTRLQMQKKCIFLVYVGNEYFYCS